MISMRNALIEKIESLLELDWKGKYKVLDMGVGGSSTKCFA